MRQQIPPEDQLCLLLARGHPTPDLDKRILELLASSPLWPLVLERAHAHQVYPLLYRNLRELGFPGVPDLVQAQLKCSVLANALRNKLLEDELARLLALLGKNGIRVIPLKGIPLAVSLFGDAASRVCADLDILVHPDSVSQARDLILASGYQTDSADPFFSKLVLRHGRHYNLVREDRGVSYPLELHWLLVQHSSKNDEAVRDLWAEARPRIFSGAPALSLSAEWELLYLCVHAADHEWKCLKWLVDVDQMASSGLVDWQKAMKKAKRFEIDLVIRQTLAACSLLWGTPLPPYCSPATLPAGLRLFDHVPFPAGAAEDAFSFRHLHVLKRPLDKLRYIATVLLAPKQTDRDFWRFPPSLGFLYYFTRPLRLACKWGGRALRKTHA